MATGKAYSGRLAFDPDTNFHTDAEGTPVVTADGGKTWHYATDEDASHFDTYHESFAFVDGTAQRLVELELEHGREKAAKIMQDEQPHHYAVTPNDPHFEEGARNSAGEVTHTRTRSTPDAKSATATGHTDAWKDKKND